MQKFLKKPEVVPHTLVFGETPKAEDFLQKISSRVPEHEYSVLPNGKPHGEFYSKQINEIGIAEERSTYKFGLLDGEYYSIKSNIFFGDEVSKGFFKDNKPHGEFFFGPSYALYEDGKLLRHECETRCPYLCSREKNTSIIQWEYQGDDLVVSQKTKKEKEWSVVVRYKSIYFEEEKWMCLPYGMIGVFSSPVPDILSKRVYAKSCVFEKGKGKNLQGPLVVPYFLY
ncbi:hypothetical protein PMV_229 [Port-miou virus]|uniref:MORN repeat-containing protein n=1 Tax=Port-miou virus TaxID=1733873 RepID=A0A0N9PVL9_9VIRU|nr:hypothetical protein PMV_229 [Port-miou virus]